MLRLRPPRSIVPLVSLTIAACGTDVSGARDTGGTVIVSTGADADAVLSPIVVTTVGKMVADLIYEPLAEIGDALNVIGDAGFTPRLAKSWTWAADSASIAFAINPAAKWHDGRPVRAQDVKFSHALFVDPAIRSISASSLSNVDSITTPDSLTAVVWFKRRSPEQFFDLVYNLRVLPEHRLGNVARDKIAESSEATNPVGSGPFRFVRWERSATVELEADTAAWTGRRPLLDRIIVSVAPDPTAAVTRVLAGEADFIEALRGDAVERIKGNPNAGVLNLPGYDYGGIFWNVGHPNDDKRPHPILGDGNVRRALAMGIDRAALVKSVLDTLAVVSEGPYVRAHSFVDTSLKAFKYNQSAAKALLDSLGWTVGRDSVRQKNGRPLELALLVPTSSAVRKSMAVILQDQFKKLGVRVRVNQQESNVMNERVFSTRKWDGVIIGWHPDPGSSGVAQNWASRNAVADGSNLSRYRNAAFDAHLDSAQTSFDVAARKAHFQQAFEILNGDAPAIWLYELRTAVGIHKRIRPGVLRPDAWWSHLDQWLIPNDQRLPRDRVGLGK